MRNPAAGERVGEGKRYRGKRESHVGGEAAGEGEEVGA